MALMSTKVSAGDIRAREGERKNMAKKNEQLRQILRGKETKIPNRVNSVQIGTGGFIWQWSHALQNSRKKKIITAATHLRVRREINRHSAEIEYTEQRAARKDERMAVGRFTGADAHVHHDLPVHRLARTKSHEESQTLQAHVAARALQSRDGRAQCLHRYRSESPFPFSPMSNRWEYEQKGNQTRDDVVLFSLTAVHRVDQVTLQLRVPAHKAYHEAGRITGE
ncbi:unnamed protein product [Trichogramma brassicae]|uniref:Uncharacterized protein n=1 Tax=Trichogramma brassicae TaxID=86971 RepID=A0A6H5J0X6_9HYME|nr:unnamed protein product [Trichogramma brassicae]